MDDGETPRGGRELVQRVALGCDHRGFEGKQVIKLFLQTLGYKVSDVGVHAGESADYPDIAVKVAR
jgi:ribose 5-phosphate isomerase B